MKTSIVTALVLVLSGNTLLHADEQADKHLDEQPSAKVQRLIATLEAELERKGDERAFGPRLPPGSKRVPWPPKGSQSGTEGEGIGDKRAGPLGEDSGEGAMNELTKLGPRAAPAVPVLIRALTKEGNPDDLRALRMNAAFTLGHIGKKAVPPLIEALSHDNSEVRFQAVHALGLNGEKAKEAIPHLLPLVEDADPLLRGKAAEALGSIGADQEGRVAAALVKLLSDDDWSVRSGAIEGLGHLGSSAKPAVPQLIQMLKDAEDNAADDSTLRGKAAVALGKIGPVTDDVVPALIDTLETDDAFVRSTAAHGLFLLGPKAKVAIPELIKVLKEPRSVPEGLSGEAAYATRLFNSNARSNAAFALARMDDENAVLVLKEVAENDPEREIREAAAMSLAMFKDKTDNE